MADDNTSLNRDFRQEVTDSIVAMIERRSPLAKALGANRSPPLQPHH